MQTRSQTGSLKSNPFLRSDSTTKKKRTINNLLKTVINKKKKHGRKSNMTTLSLTSEDQELKKVYKNTANIQDAVDKIIENKKIAQSVYERVDNSQKLLVRQLQKPNLKRFEKNSIKKQIRECISYKKEAKEIGLATDHLLNKLEYVLDVYFFNPKMDTYDVNLNCRICFELLNSDNMSLLSCGHLFCTSCITTWFAENHKCGYCAASHPSYIPLHSLRGLLTIAINSKILGNNPTLLNSLLDEKFVVFS